jgi:hypothetical protein
MIKFGRDYGRPDVEKLARAICKERGFPPDTLVRDNGYADSAMVPMWWRFQDDAINFIAMKKADEEATQ